MNSDSGPASGLLVGNVRSNTMRAFSADEMTTIIGKTG